MNRVEPDRGRVGEGGYVSQRSRHKSGHNRSAPRAEFAWGASYPLVLVLILQAFVFCQSWPGQTDAGLLSFIGGAVIVTLGLVSGAWSFSTGNRPFAKGAAVGTLVAGIICYTVYFVVVHT